MVSFALYWIGVCFYCCLQSKIFAQLQINASGKYLIKMYNHVYIHESTNPKSLPHMQGCKPLHFFVKVLWSLKSK